jgi:hypothetical protein
MNLFTLILLVNSFTLAVTVLAAIKRPIWSYKLIAGIELCATAFALHQVLAGRGSALALLFTALLVIMMMWRIALNLRRPRVRRRR